MKHKTLIASTIALLTLALWVPVRAQGGGPTGMSDPSPVVNGGIYQWPEVQSPCPEVQIKQKHDHVPLPQYQERHWDTAITCRERQIVLSAMPYIPVQFTNGYYYVDVIPYNPPDPTFSLGTRMPIGTDDVFAGSYTDIPFPFYFFGQRKNKFRIGANGLVTFCDPSLFGSGNSCPWSFRAASNKLPWNGTAGHTDPFDQPRMRDAIYGVMEDTHPGLFTGSETNRIDGIFYGVQDEYPCRKIICSWKEAPDFGASSQKATYQIVCYEGSNIIEVHVKRRSCCPTTSDAMIGIQNATGQPQTKSSDPDNPLYWITPGAPAAFFPTGYNGFTSTIDTMAFRFTPYGSTLATDGWYRILTSSTGADSAVQLTTNPTDTNGYYVPANPVLNPTAPTLTLAYVSPTTVSRYYYHLRFRNANGDWYNLNDTITIGIDTLNDLTITPAQQDICLGTSAAPTLEFRSVQDTELVNWTLTRVSNGQSTPLATSGLSFGQINDNGTNKTLSITVNSNTLPTDGQLNNKIDTLIIHSSVDFVSGCHGDASTMIRIFPNFDTTDYAGICRGEQFTWDDNGQIYTETTHPPYPTVTLRSQPGCDSIVHLNLTVYDVSHTVDRIVDCRPLTWINGRTYNQSNTATIDRDTIVLPNRYGCDSIVQLDFTLLPLTARLQASLDHFDYDHLDVELTDLSTGGGERVWHISGSPDQTTPVAYYTIPVELDSAVVQLVAASPYGCTDTATLVIPFHKESFWVPNAFTPDNPAGNNTFGSVSTQTLQQEMLIYNRFGEMVFRCDTPDCQWDGRDLNGNPCIQGAYVYIIRYTTSYQPNKTLLRKGTVTLLR
ncbi:MAG: gliding motility-associated C-terminal domain-containing protein [Bacteroidales bacterium]|nr:gliding motility-associated C-terminal domain-containing protein [Bacteroidales bacterium]